MKKNALETRKLGIGYGKKDSQNYIAENLDLELRAGQLVCILGSNGAGKSTLLRTLAGLQPAIAGEILIGDAVLENLKPAELARSLSLVLTDRIETGNLTAYEIVTLGRTPYTSWLGALSDDDHGHVAEAIAKTSIQHLAYRKIRELSDGERQKVMLARALAQDTPLILLDEPTAHLDLPNRVEMMQLLHQLARGGKAILMSTHELDLALQSADELWLMGRDGRLASGTPEDLVLSGAFEAAFGGNGFSFDRTTGNFMIRHAKGLLDFFVDGPHDLAFWTKRALEREGYGISLTEQNGPSVRASRQGAAPCWTLQWKTGLTAHHSISSLLSQIRSFGPFDK